MISRIDICRQIAKEMNKYKIDGYWYGRHETVITKVTCQNKTDNDIEDLAQEILRVATRGYKHYPMIWNREYGCEMYDETQPYTLSWDWKYRKSITNWISEHRQGSGK